MQNWFPTLNAALESEGLLETWDCTRPPIAYGDTARYVVERNGRFHQVSIYRDEQGRYERPVHYDCGRVR